MEEWKNIEGYDGLYKVSNLGRVKSLGNEKTRKEKILKTGKTKDGYLYVILCKEGKVKMYYVHRLVAQAFIPNPDNLPQVNHLDEDKMNNNISNLEWCYQIYNVKYGTGSKRSALNRINHPTLSKKVLCVETGVTYSSTMDAYRQTGVAHTNISSCCNGKLKTAGKLHWQFV